MELMTYESQEWDSNPRRLVLQTSASPLGHLDILLLSVHRIIEISVFSVVTGVGPSRQTHPIDNHHFNEHA